MALLSFENVGLAYGGDNVAHDVSFTVQPGQTVAVMGPTGSGKTTLIHLLARFYDVTEGAVRVDGCDVRKWKLSQLRSSIGTARARKIFRLRWEGSSKKALETK